MTEDAALQDLQDLHSSGIAVRWPCCGMDRSARKVSSSSLEVLPMTQATFGCHQQELRSPPAVEVSQKLEEALAELAELEACGLPVRWPTS